MGSSESFSDNGTYRPMWHLEDEILVDLILVEKRRLCSVCYSKSQRMPFYVLVCI